MASPDGDFSSLFDGMVLFSPADDPPPPQPPSPSTSAPTPLSRAPSTSSEASAVDPPSLSDTSQPLDEDLFSDLTLQSPSPIADPAPVAVAVIAPARQISRKKKRAVRIGYGRDTTFTDSDPDPLPPPPPSVDQPVIPNLAENSLPIPVSDDHSAAFSIPEEPFTVSASEKHRDIDTVSGPQDQPTQVVELDKVLETGTEDTVASMEENLRVAKERISNHFERIREKAMLVSVKRKEAGRRRRKAVEDLRLATGRHRELEKELEEACEAEDFEKAEMVSESLAEAEKEKDGLVSVLRDAEVECDAVDLEMEKVLEMQIAAEEEEAAILEQFAKDAADQADLILTDSEETAMKELEEWESSMELLEIKRFEMDIESQLICEARVGLNESIEHLVENERREQDILTRKKDTLADELHELLGLVRLKQAEISENDCKIQEVEKRISDVFSEFQETQSIVDLKHDSLQSALSTIDLEGESLITKRKVMDEVISLAQEKISKLRVLGSCSLDEARTCQDMVGLRKTLALSILKSREDKVKLGRTEEQVLEDILILRQQISAARTNLQDLSSTRVGIQQEIASFKQKLDYIEKRGPELEAEKKVAATARNFKEAGRIAAEAKSLSVERETLRSKKEKAVSDLEKLEEEIKDTLDKIQESEKLISLKEKEAATAGCRRLRLAAAASRAERSAAIKLGDTEEGDILLNEAEDAESKAKELQEAYDLEWEELGKAYEHVVSLSLVTNLTRQHLAETASSFSLPSGSG